MICALCQQERDYLTSELLSVTDEPESYRLYCPPCLAKIAQQALGWLDAEDRKSLAEWVRRGGKGRPGREGD